MTTRADPDHEGDDAEGASRRTTTSASGRSSPTTCSWPTSRRRRAGTTRASSPTGPLAARPGDGGAALRPGHLRRAQGLPRRGRQGAALPAAEARGAAEQLGAAHVHPAARRRPGAAIHRARSWASSGSGCRRRSGTSLYIRPTIIASEAFLGVRPAKSYIYFVILSPVGAYYPEGMAPVKILVVDKYVRAVDGGARRRQDGRQLRGEPVRGRGGQARGLHAGAVARRRAPEVHRRGRHHEHHGEDRRRDRSRRRSRGTILPGVTRDSVLALMREWGLQGDASGRSRSTRWCAAARAGHAARRCGARAPPPSSRRWASWPTRAERMVINDGKIGDAHPAALRRHRGHPVRRRRPTRDGWTVEV